jgi:hypothetical protein
MQRRAGATPSSRTSKQLSSLVKDHGLTTRSHEMTNSPKDHAQCAIASYADGKWQACISEMFGITKLICVKRFNNANLSNHNPFFC